MNSVIMIGRLVADPETRYSTEQTPTAITRFRIAVDRRFKREGQPTADFFQCVAFGKQGEFVDKWFRKGSKIVVQGWMRNDNYKDKDGKTVYGMQIVCENVEFGESKTSSAQNQNTQTGTQRTQPKPDEDGFMQIPDSLEGEELPFM